MSDFMAPRQLAERWNCSARHVRRLCASGELRAMRLGQEAWRISLGAVAEYEYAHSTPEVGGPDPAPKTQEVRPVTTVAGFTLPDDYVPVFPHLWPGHEARTKKAASSRH
jgi:excisionase family DNA binding protein